MANNGVVDKGDWFKVHHNGWLEGSMRAKDGVSGDVLAAYRGVCADLLALISRSRFRDGTLRRAVGRPMDRQWIANTLNISLELLNAVIEDGANDINKENGRKRIEVWEDGTIEFTNWNKYQAKSAKILNKQKVNSNNVPLTQDEMAEKEKALALHYAYKQPEYAKTGIERKEMEQIHKGR